MSRFASVFVAVLADAALAKFFLQAEDTEMPKAYPDQLCDQSGRLDLAPLCRGCSLAQCQSACHERDRCQYYAFNPNVAPHGGLCMAFSSCSMKSGHPGFTVYASLKSTSGVKEQQETQASITLLASKQPSPGLSVDECIPQCNWQCQAPKCDQHCKPKCQPPACQTRCSGMNTKGCNMECEKPVCAVVCSDRPCGKKECPRCQTECSQPMCKLACPSGLQNCKNVCERPRCQWDCSAEQSCPHPTCTMKCESPKACANMDSTYEQLPPIQQGESVVAGFVTPVLLQEQLAARRSGKQVTAGSLSVMVPITTAVQMPGSKEVKLVNSTLKLPVM